MLTIIIIAVTSFISVRAFQNNRLIDQYIFYPPAIKKGEWWRLASYGVLHADWSHLIFNMFSLYLFGKAVEASLIEVFGGTMGGVIYLLLYLSGLVLSIVPTWIQKRNDYAYRSLGASGAVSAVVFAYILFYPMSYMGLMFIPVFLPAFLFGGLYVAASVYMEKKQMGNINHSAHIFGAIWGMIYLLVVFGMFAGINLFSHFMESIAVVSWSDLVKFGY